MAFFEKKASRLEEIFNIGYEAAKSSYEECVLN